MLDAFQREADGARCLIPFLTTELALALQNAEKRETNYLDNKEKQDALDKEKMRK